MLRMHSLLLVALTMLFSPVTLAAPGDAPADAALPRWEWGVGAGAAWLSDYPGSAHESAFALPYPWLVLRSERAELGRSGLRGILTRSPHYRVDFTLGANPPSESKDNPERQGMSDLDAVLKPGVYLQWRTLLDDAGRWRLDLKMPVRMAFRLDERLRSYPVGAEVEPGLSIARRFGENVEWTLGGNIGFAEAGYNDFYYGVPASAATPTRPAYVAGGGYTGNNLSTRLNVKRGRLSTGFYVSVDFVGRASFTGSPLVAVDEGYAVGSYFNWQIARSQRTIAGDAQDE